MLSAGDLELNVNSDGVEGMDLTDIASGLGGSCTTININKTTQLLFIYIITS